MIDQSKFTSPNLNKIITNNIKHTYIEINSTRKSFFNKVDGFEVSEVEMRLPVEVRSLDERCHHHLFLFCKAQTVQVH